MKTSSGRGAQAGPGDQQPAGPHRRVLLFDLSLANVYLWRAKAIEIPVLRFMDRVFPPVPKSRMASKILASTEELGEARPGGVVVD